MNTDANIFWELQFTVVKTFSRKRRGRETGRDYLFIPYSQSVLLESKKAAYYLSDRSKLVG